MINLSKNWTFHGDWIMAPETDYGEEDNLYYQVHNNTIVKKVFTLKNLERSTLYVGVLGYYIAYVNGKRVGDYELNSDWVNYTKCVYYDVYDITPFLQVGENSIIFELGNGMYNPSPLKLMGKYNLRRTLAEIGEPRVICDIVNNDKVVLSSDDSWKYSKGNTIFNNLYLGEKVDNTHIYDTWKTIITKNEKRNYRQSIIPKIKRHKEIQAVKFYQTKEGIIYDFGETVSGFINIEWEASEKQVLQIQYSELMDGNQLDFHTCLAGNIGHTIDGIKVCGGLGSPKRAIQTDQIISKQGLNTFTNKFSYHSFRFALVSNIELEKIEKISAIYVHTDLQQVGHMDMDHTFYKELYDIATRTKLNNIHSTFEDCARERLGYGGDMVALATSNLYMFDLAKFYEKIVADFRMEQTEKGGIPETAPYMGIQTNGTDIGEGPILWQFVLPYLVSKHYQFYGNKDFVWKEYPYIKKQMLYLLSYDLEQLVQCCIGDHGSLLLGGNFRRQTPDKELVGYCTILLFLKYNIYLADIVGEDTAMYKEKYKEIYAVVIRKFLNDDGTIGEGTQSGLAFSTALGIDDGESMCKKLVNKIRQDDYVFNSGIFGMMFTYEMLNKYGYDDVIEKWLLKLESPSFADMIKTGNKALSELFVGEEQSMNHAMFSSYQQWYYQGLAGIQIEDHAAGFNAIKFKPYLSPFINAFKCTVLTSIGNIESSWQRKHKNVNWVIKIPEKLKDFKIELPNGYSLIERTDKHNEIVMLLKNREID